MDPLFYVIAIMGCGDGNTACQQARVEPAHYQSIRACQHAMSAALARNSDVDYPVITATCHESGEMMAQSRIAPSRRG